MIWWPALVRSVTPSSVGSSTIGTSLAGYGSGDTAWGPAASRASATPSALRRGGAARARRWLQTDRTEHVPPCLRSGVLGIGFACEWAEAHTSTPNRRIEATSVPKPGRRAPRGPPDTTRGYSYGVCNP